MIYFTQTFENACNLRILAYVYQLPGSGWMVVDDELKRRHMHVLQVLVLFCCGTCCFCLL